MEQSTFHQLLQYFPHTFLSCLYMSSCNARKSVIVLWEIRRRASCEHWVSLVQLEESQQLGILCCYPISSVESAAGSQAPICSSGRLCNLPAGGHSCVWKWKMRYIASALPSHLSSKYYFISSCCITAIWSSHAPWICVFVNILGSTNRYANLHILICIHNDHWDSDYKE